MSEKTMQTEDASTVRDSKRRWWLIGTAAAVTVACAVGVAVWAGSASGPAANQTGASDQALVTSVAAGSGGTATAVDGVTKIGYESSCTGAVQAASNYDATVNLYKPASDQDFIKLVNQVFVSPQAADPFLKESAKSFDDGKIWKYMGVETSGTDDHRIREPQQEWGGAFKVESCTPGQSASVLLYSCYIIYKDPQKSFGFTDCDPVRAGLNWSSGDWKLTSLGYVPVMNQDGIPRNFNFVMKGASPHPPGVTAAQWAKLTAPDKTGPITGWVDFSNAHR